MSLTKNIQNKGISKTCETVEILENKYDILYNNKEDLNNKTDKFINEK